MPIMIENIKIYEVSEIAKKLKAKPKDVQDLVMKKKLTGQKIGNKYYVTENNLKAFFGEKSSNLDEWNDFHDEAGKIKKLHESGKRKTYKMEEAFKN
jgi:hypothetical protein